MPPDKIQPFDDPRVSYRSAHLNGLTYGYLYSAPPPSTPARGTILLIHGFPDLSFGWRYQIPYLNSLGLTCIAPDCVGYGRTDAPPYSLRDYTFRRLADDMAELCRQLDLSSVILGGHDWGGACAWRMTQYHPSLCAATFVICVPFFTPGTEYETLASVVKTKLPKFGYQLNFASGTLEDHVRSPDEIRRFLHNMYGARTADGRVAFSPEKGVDLDAQRVTGKNKLLSDDEMDYYVREYSRHGVHGPLNWYRTGEPNYDDELEFFFDAHKKPKRDLGIKNKEVLFVLAANDTVLRPSMAAAMPQRIERLTRREVKAGHWAMWQKPDEINSLIGRWLKEKVWRDSKL